MIQAEFVTFVEPILGERIGSALWEPLGLRMGVVVVILQ